jgi:hypothetical protein
MNSHERSNLDTKGCAAFPGIIKAGQNMMAMLNIEFPSLVYFNSIERTKVERNFPILNEMKSMKPASFEYYLASWWTVYNTRMDFWSTGSIIWVSQ